MCLLSLREALSRTERDMLIEQLKTMQDELFLCKQELTKADEKYDALQE